MRTMLAITLLLGLGWAQSLPTPQAVLNRLSQKAKTTRAYAYQWDYFKRDPQHGQTGRQTGLQAGVPQAPLPQTHHHPARPVQ